MLSQLREGFAAGPSATDLPEPSPDVIETRIAADPGPVDRPPDVEVPQTRPTIPVTDRALREVSDAAVAALEAANAATPELFRRGTDLARVRFDDGGQPQIETVGESILRYHLDRAAAFVKQLKNGEERPVAPPLDVVRDVLARPSYPFPRLVGVTEAPCFRPDGTVLATPGYDTATGIFYAPQPGLQLPEVPREPTDAEVAEARDRLLEVFEDFPFDGDASRAAALALPLTLVLRPAIAGCVPVGIIDATKAGSGKGLLVTATAKITTGRPAAVLPTPTREEEMQKTVAATALRGAPLAMLDECRELSSPTLAAAVTSEEYELRVLGRSEMVRVPHRAFWLVAGNNVQIGGDLARRSFRIRLDARHSRPWQRQGFRHPDLAGWIVENRGALLGACLTLGRAYFARGCPRADVPPLGGFEGWAQTIGGILQVAGVDGFLSDLDAFYDEADAESAAWESFLGRCLEVLGAGAWFVGDLVKAVNADDGLKEALPDDELGEALDRSPRAFGAKMGKALAARNGTRFGNLGLHVVKVGKDPRSGSARWEVRAEVDDRTSANGNGSGKPKGHDEPQSLQRLQRSGGYSYAERKSGDIYRDRDPRTSATSATSADEGSSAATRDPSAHRDHSPNGGGRDQGSGNPDAGEGLGASTNGRTPSPSPTDAARPEPPMESPEAMEARA